MRAVNLIPQDQRRRVAGEGDGKSAPIVLGVLGALLVLVVVYLMTGNTVTQRQSDAKAASAAADQLEARAGKQTSYTNFAQIAATRMESVAGVAATRFDWERFMRELGRVMPDGSWLQSADASVLGDPTSTTTSTPAPAADAAAAVTPAANLIGCTPGQDDVADLMVRLRELYRVDDVLLNESSVGSKEEKAAVDNCGNLYTFNLTVKFTAAGPLKETPRGSKTVPASLGGGIVSVTDRDRKILLALVPIVLLVAYWFLLLAPKRDEASTAGTELSTQQQRLDDARAQVKSAEGAKQNFNASYAEIVRLGKAIPSTVDMPSLLVQLDAAAAGTGIRFTKIATGERVQGAAPPATATTAAPPAGSQSGTTGTPVAAGGATAQSAPGGAAEAANNAQQTSNQSTAAAENSGVSPSDTQTSTSSGSGLPVGGGTTPATNADGTAAAPVGLETVPLNLEFEGDFFNLADFFHRVKRFVSLTKDNVIVSGRLVTVDSIRWASDQEIFPHIRAEITATIYLSPKAQGVTAGATPQGPTTTPGVPATGTTPAPAESTPAAAPTATATP